MQYGQYLNSEPSVDLMPAINHEDEGLRDNGFQATDEDGEGQNVQPNSQRRESTENNVQV